MIKVLTNAASWLIDSCLVTMSSHGLSLVLVCGRGGRTESASSVLSFKIRTLTLLDQGSTIIASCKHIISLETSLQIQTHW